MPYVKHIPLSKITIIARLQDAPVGALLQIAAHNSAAEPAGDPPAIPVLRVSININGADTKGIILLEGSEAGIFINDVELDFRPAIDIGALAQIVVADAAPRAFGVGQRIAGGDVCQASTPDAKDFLCIAVRLVQSPALVGYARLAGAQRGNIVRTMTQFPIGNAAVVPLTLEEIAHSAG